MPELPEVETVLCGLKPHLEGAVIESVVLRHHQLRWPIPSFLDDRLKQQPVGRLSRRGKYILMPVGSGTLVLHLGMSGNLRILPRATPPGRHDHVDVIYSDTHLLRFNDPRRFGAILWTEDDPHQHPLLKQLGVEPFGNFTPEYLRQAIKNRRISIKSLIMDSRFVTGIGNIYAQEALFSAKIHPLTSACLLTDAQCIQLVTSIKLILQKAVQQGGTTLKDFVNSEGKPGYFTQHLQVYARSGLPCVSCQTLLHSIKQGQRSTVFCPQCQPSL